MKPKVIVIVGPTASGKTDLSINLAKEINGEIISADSMQIYKKMDIGTAKPSKEEMQGIPHYMIDIVEPSENFNVAKYKKMAEAQIKDVLARGKQPIIVGGTGLYVDTLVKGIEFKEVENDLDYRKQLEEETIKKGNEWLFGELEKIDPEAAKTIEKNNTRRVIRALEIYKVTGKTKTQLDKESITETPYDYRVYGLLWDRETLNNRINKRVDSMLKAGLLDEVKNLITSEKLSKTALQGLGYKEVVSYFNGELTYDEMVERIKTDTRRYAKRQMTWFKRYENIIWLDAKEKEEMLRQILSEM